MWSQFMKKYLLSIVFVTSLLLSNLFAQAEITSRLSDALAEASKDNSTVRSLVILKDQVDINSLDKQLYETKATLEERAYIVITTLQQKANTTQSALIEYLDNKYTDEVSEYRSFWITNMVFVDAVPTVILEMAERNEIAVLDLDAELAWDEPVKREPAAAKIPGGIEPGLAAINAPAMWAAGYTGAGRIVMNDDTGVDGNHPAINYKWRGAQTGVPASAAWFSWNGSTTFPVDGDGHGTHTMGTMCGLDPATQDTVGVAPGAQWIASDGLWGSPHTSYSIAAWQWAVDPDGNPGTIDDMPDAIGNSWYDPSISATNECNPALNPYINAHQGVEAAGIAIIFSAGNSGPSSTSITQPKNVNIDEVTFWATGSVNGNNPSFPISSYSSRGPVHSSCTTGTPSLDIKPEASAPGENVRSSTGGGYSNFSGTSMACPHVVGAIALLREAHPGITGKEAKEALYATAVDLGDPGEDNTYGMGIIDVYAAHLSLADPDDPNPPSGFSAYSDYATPTSMLLNWTDPSTYFNGNPLTSFQIYVYRDASLVATVASGAETYTDNGLTDGQSYSYSIVAADIPNDSLSTEVFASWTAGGSPVPMAATAFAVSNASGGDLNASWTSPTDQVDGTMLDDYAGVNLYENGTLLTTFSRTSSDTGMADSDVFTPSTTNAEYWVTAIDNETPVNESVASNSAFPPYAAPYLEDFENAVVGTPGTLPVQWINETGDDFDWFVHSGGTTSSGTGPTGDHTTGSGNYMYTESSSPNYPTMEAQLTTPTIDISTLASPGLSFWYHMHGATMGELHVDVYHNGMWNLDVMTALVGQQQAVQTDPWMQEIVDLSAYTSTPIQVRFRGITSTSYTSDMAIDDVYFTSLSGNPSMVVSPQVIGDTLLVGASAMHQFDITNAQASPTTLNFTVTEDPVVSWLSVTPSSGAVTSTNTTTIDVSIDVTGLTAGTYTTDLIVAGDDTTNSEDTVAVSVQVNDAPTVGATPDSMSFSLFSNSVDSLTLSITNSGGGPLYFTLDDEDVSERVRKQRQVDLSYINPSHQVEIGKDEVDWRQGTAQTEGMGGPDLFGYTWKDSDEPGGPTFGWIDISATGTQVPCDGAMSGNQDGALADDDFEGPFPIGFTFNFYGNQYTDFYIQSNGMINFIAEELSLSNQQIPVVDTYNNLIAWCWDDLDPGNAATEVYYETVGNKLIISFINYYEYPDGGAAVDAQVILSPNGKVLVQYDHFDSGFDLIGSTVGIENADGSDGLQVVYNGAYLHDQLALVYALDSEWLSSNPTSGVVAPGGQTDVQVRANTDQMFGGDYLANVIIESNDPVTPEYRVPVSLHVSGVADITAYPSPMDWGTIFTNVNDTMYLTIENIGTDTLHISGITNTDPEFTIVGNTAFYLLIGETYDLPVIFNSATAGTYNDALVIANNSVNNPSLLVGLDGITIDPPTVNVDPLALSDSLLSGQTSVHYFDVFNTGSSPLYFEIEVEDVTVESIEINKKSKRTAETPQQVPQNIPTLSKGISVFAEASPKAGGGSILTPSIEALWDMQFNFNLETASGALGNAGGEFDGTYYYTTRWASNLIHQYDMAGNLVQEFSIPGVTGLRDLAYDGTYFYGGAAANTIFIMDFTTQTLIGTITSPEGVRNIAYDSANDGFWVGNWTTDIVLVDRSGATLASIPAATHALTSVYGSAYDEYSAGGPYLWLFHQGVSGAEAHIAQIDIATGMQTGVTHDMLVDFPATSPLAGGLWVNSGVASGFASIGGVAQGTPDMFFALELTEAANWVSTNPVMDTVAVGDTVQVAVTFDATGLISGLYEADIHVNSNDPVTPTVTVDASLHVTGVANIAVDPTSLDFGFLFQGVADTMTFAVQNPGTADLNVSGLATSTAEFSVLTATPFTVTPGNSTDVEVVFSASAAGVHTDSVVVTHDAPIVMSDVVQVTGETANPPVIALSDTLLQHQLMEGEEDSTMLMIYNNGASTLDYELRLGNDPFMEASNYAGQAIDPSVVFNGKSETGPVSDPGLAPAHYTGEAIWDVQLTFDCEAASGALGNAGAEFDGTYFYSTRWASNLIHQYDATGALVQEFSIAGVTGLRDLAFDGTYFYGGAAANTIYIMDFVSQTLVGTITSPEGVRNIAYNEDLDAFYVGNWTTDIYLVDRNGNTLSTIPAASHALTSVYGSAYDNISDGGPYLWLFHQGVSGAEAHMTQIDLATGMQTGVTHDVLADLPASSPLAGGMFITTDLVSGKATIGGLAQGTPDMMICYELAEAATWVTLDHTMGSVAPGDSGSVMVYWHGVITEQIHDGYLGVYSNDPVTPVENVHLVLDVISSIDGITQAMPTKYALHQNFPNPFNPSTIIKYDLKAKTDVKLTIYNVLGQKVRTLVNTNQAAGFKNIVWNGLNDVGEQVSTGIYIYRIEADGFVKSRKMVFMK